MTHRSITGEPVSPRHRRTLVLLANGHHNADIAKALRVRPHTADKYVNEVLARLGAVDRAHAVALAIRHGYLGIDDIDTHPELPTADELFTADEEFPPGPGVSACRRRRRGPTVTLPDISTYQPAA